MAQTYVTTNEVVQIIHQWHQGGSSKGIRRSPGFDPKTVREYVKLAQTVGVCRAEPLPQGSELIGKIKPLTDSSLLREIVNDLASFCFKEEKGVLISYYTMKRYLMARFQFGAPHVTVCQEVEPRSQAQVDFGYV